MATCVDNWSSASHSHTRFTLRTPRWNHIFEKRVWNVGAERNDRKENHPEMPACEVVDGVTLGVKDASGKKAGKAQREEKKSV
jgi:hypothetical protein